MGTKNYWPHYTGTVLIRVIKTNEELMTARSACDIINNNTKN